MDGEVEVPKAKRAESRRQRAWELRCQGLSYPSIAKALGCSQSTAWELVHRTEEEAHKFLAEAAVQAKVEHLGQLEAVKEQAALAYRRDGKPQSLSVILKTIELERKVLGLDNERQAYLDERFLAMHRRHDREREETARDLAKAIEACVRADDEGRKRLAEDGTPVGRLAREIEAEKASD